MALLREAGFQRVERIPTDGKPGVFATLDAGAPRTVGVYLMYDVKQFDPREWSSPPLEGRIVDKPGFGKAMVGRGAVNQKGPQSAFLAALHAIRGAGRKPPVNLVAVAEGEEEIGSPHLVQALATLVTADGDPAIDGFADRARPISPEDAKMIDAAAARRSEELAKKELGATRWLHDATWRESLARLVSRPTVNIEGLVAGYTGPGGKTVLPHRAVAKLDLRLVPDMTFDGAVAALRAHLARRGFGDIEVVPTGGYDPTQTPASASLIQKQIAVYRSYGLEAPLWPRGAGSYPGWVFTGAPLGLPCGHFGVGYGGGAHAPDEYYLIESANPRLRGYDDAVRSFVDYLYQLAN